MKAGRYEIREKLGEGGMGIVYLAIDPVVNREVTVKTIRDPQDNTALELFKRECAVLASMTHPNIVEIFDVGETEESGLKRPYFVMPRLPGVTLKELMDASSPRLNVERSIQMMVQVCRGLQAAHELGLIHRDLKPSNLFVLPDDSVKIIDFGMAHLVNHRSVTELKGTPPYMAPEQLQRMQPTALSDQFSLAVVCYEVLARRHPFADQEDLARAILSYAPPPMSKWNPVVSPAVCQVIHKALAKEPFNRFSDVRQFAEYMQKALRGEPIDIFDPARIAPRLERARKAFESGELDDAADRIKELETESLLAPEIDDLRRQIEDTRRTKTIRQLLDTARRRLDDGDYVLALQKVHEVLNLDATNTEAFTLKGAVETKRSGTQIEDWLKLAKQHVENHGYTHARQALEKVLDLRPKEVRALSLLQEVERREQEHVRLSSEKQHAYQSALEAYKRGDVNSALTKLERILDLDRRAPDSSVQEQGATYQKLYEEVRSRRDQLTSKESEARRLLTDGNFGAARALCEEVLAAFPNNVLFLVLLDDVEQAERQEISAYVAKIEREVSDEPDLNRKVSILEEARTKYPSEPRFEQSLQQVKSRRDRVDSIVGRARAFEESRQFSDALGQWEMLRSIYPKFPGLDIHIDRLHKRREQQVRDEGKSHWVTQIDQALGVRNYVKASALAEDALKEYPGDPELAAIAKQANQAQTRASEAEEKATQGKVLCESGRTQEGLATLREAFQLDSHSPVVRGGLIDAISKEAGRQVDTNWQGAEPLVQEVLDLDPANPLAKSLTTLIQDKRQGEEISAALSKARELQAQGSIAEAIAELDKIQVHRRDTRLNQLRDQLQESLSPKDRADLRSKHLEEVNRLSKQAKETSDPQALESIFQATNMFARYGRDEDFKEPLSTIEQRTSKIRPNPSDVPTMSIYMSPSGGPAMKLPEPPSAASSTAKPPNATSPAAKPPATKPPAPKAMPKPGPKEGSAPILGMSPAILWPLIGVLAVMLVMVVALRHRIFGGPAAASVATTRVPVQVTGAERDQYHVFNSSNMDVTAELDSGLAAGDYRLDASRLGSAPFTLAFTVDPAAGSTKSLQVAWQALPAKLAVRLSQAAGTLKVDGTAATLNDKSFTVEWPNGTHSVRWGTSDNAFVEIPFEVADGAVTMKDPVVQGATGVSALATVVSGNKVAYQAINVFGGITENVDGLGDSSPFVMPKGEFTIPDGKQVSLKSTKYNVPMGDLQTDPHGEPVVSVYLVVPAGGSAVPAKRPAATDAAKTDARPQPAGPSADDLRKQQEKDRADQAKKAEDEKAKKALDRFNGVQK